jgi:hypothetical protein
MLKPGWWKHRGAQAWLLRQGAVEAELQEQETHEARSYQNKHPTERLGGKAPEDK